MLLYLLHGPDMKMSCIFSTADAKTLKATNFTKFFNANPCLDNKYPVAFNKMHPYFQTFPEEQPISLCRRGCSYPAPYPHKPAVIVTR